LVGPGYRAARRPLLRLGIVGASDQPGLLAGGTVGDIVFRASYEALVRALPELLDPSFVADLVDVSVSFPYLLDAMIWGLWARLVKEEQEEVTK